MLTMEAPHGDSKLKQTIKKLNLWGKTAVDKSAWIKPCIFIISFH